MKEDFLHYVWRSRSFNWHQLKTTDGQIVQIRQFGEWNKNAGPDFLHARIQIGAELWVGNVEIHLRSSDWWKHQHQNDKAYDNVILHVVYEDDKRITKQNGQSIPCLELKHRIPKGLIGNYQVLLGNSHWIPCQAHIAKVEGISRELWLDRLMVERLEKRTQTFLATLEYHRNNWEEVFYQHIARSLGLYVNTTPFEQLARSLPLAILQKHKHHLLQIEALLFGQAGLLLGEFEEDYPNQLKKEYTFLQHKYQLKALLPESWKFSRLRPANFPTIRIAQLAALIFQSEHLFHKILAIRNAKEIEAIFDLRLSPYWNHHYQFDQPSVKRKKSLGKHTIRLLVINTIAPLLFMYGHLRSEERYKELALHLLESLPPEDNHIIRKWNSLGLKAINAQQSQALLQLKQHYCEQKACMQCAIGHQLMCGKRGLKP
ncbi:MAG: DUF2851 family protein [Bacteroidota bacterium]